MNKVITYSMALLLAGLTAASVAHAMPSSPKAQVAMAPATVDGGTTAAPGVVASNTTAAPGVVSGDTSAAPGIVSGGTSAAPGIGRMRTVSCHDVPASMCG